MSLAGVRARIDAACRRAGRTDVTLVAISKTHPPERIAEVLDAGQRVFGENRVQEAAAKWPELRARHEGIELHLVGPLQTNKLRQALALFDTIETLDRPKLARLLAAEVQAAGRCPRLFVQVNTGAEPQKAGILPGAADTFLAECRVPLGLPVEGLMCIPPDGADPEPHFRLLAGIAARNGLALLSMGMSGDFETAIACGATHVRVGSAIFGARLSG